MNVLARRFAWGHTARTSIVMLALALVAASLIATAWAARRNPGDSGLLVWLVAAQLTILVLAAALVRRSHRDAHKIRGLNLELNASLVQERRLAGTDALTGLLNARAFTEELTRERARGQRSGQILTVAYIDLDHFKRVNDMLGHAEGDQLLTSVAQVIRDSTRAGDVAGRVGGDEFAVLFHSTCSKRVVEIARRISLGVERLTAVRFSPALGASIGLLEVAPSDDLSVREIVGRADEAMCKVKAAGRQESVVTRESMAIATDEPVSDMRGPLSPTHADPNLLFPRSQEKQFTVSLAEQSS